MPLDAASHYVACDLGASSGRVMLGTLNRGQLQVQEMHRFTNSAVRLGDRLSWNLIGIYAELLNGLAAVGRAGVPVTGVSVDSWGVDYAWFRRSSPYPLSAACYRDTRTEAAHQRLGIDPGRDTIYSRIGIQPLYFNTLYQLATDVQTQPEVLAVADQFLPVADYLNYLLCGVACAERSLASTSELYNPATLAWDPTLLNTIGLDVRLTPKVVVSGTVLGPLQPHVRDETGLSEATRVIASCSHDTASAVAAVPASGSEGWAYISSGTWSLLGVERATPILTPAARAAGFTNELGVSNTVRFLKNIAGLWMLQECRRAWDTTGQALDFPALVIAAEACEPVRSLVQPNHRPFLEPGHMPEKIQQYCRATSQPVPQSAGEIARCVLDSLALCYASTLIALEQLTGEPVHTIHVVGGGSQNKLLNQLTADATGKTVVAGPVEATAIGNALVQALALGHVASLADLRDIVRRSFPVEHYRPVHSTVYAAAHEPFTLLPS